MELKRIPSAFFCLQNFLKTFFPQQLLQLKELSILFFHLSKSGKDFNSNFIQMKKEFRGRFQIDTKVYIELKGILLAFFWLNIFFNPFRFSEVIVY